MTDADSPSRLPSQLATVAADILPEEIGSDAAAGTTGLSVIAGGIWNSLSQVLPQIFALILSVVAAHYLGPSGMGRQSFIAFTMISLSLFVSEGLKEALMRSIGEVLGAGRLGAVRGLVHWGLPILVSGGIAGGLVLVVAGLLGASPPAAWILAGIECALLVGAGMPWAILVGSQRWRQASIVGLATGAVALPVTIGVLEAGGGIVGIFAVEAITTAVALVLLTGLARRTLRALPSVAEIDHELRRRTASYAALASMMTLATFVVWQRSEFFFLDAYSTDREIAFYSIAFAAANGLALVPGALAGTLSPAFATLYGARQYGRIRSGYWRAQRLLPVISLPLMAGFIALGPALIRLVYGHSYAAAGSVLVILLLLFPLLPLLGVATSLLIGLGRLRVALGWEVVGGAVTICLNFLLVPGHAAVGAAIADTGGQLVVTVPLLLYAGRHVRPSALDPSAIVRAILASLPAGVVAWALDTQLGGVVGLVVAAIGGVLVFLPLALALRVVPAMDREWVGATVSSRFGERAARLIMVLVGPGITDTGESSAAKPTTSHGAVDDDGPACRSLVVYSDASERGGAEQVLGYLVEALDERIDITVVGVDSKVVSWIASRRPNTAEVLLPRVRHKAHLGPVIAHLRALRRLRPDVLHANLNNPWSCQYGILAGLLTPGTRVVAVEHAVVPSTHRLQRLTKRVVSRKLAAHVAVGESSAREIERLIGLDPRSLTTILNGVPDAPPTSARRSWGGSAVIGTVSRVGPHKGTDLIVRVLPTLPNARAVVVGDGPGLEELRALARELGVSSRLETPGFEPSPRWRLETFDVFVLPTRAEASLPLAIIEAMLAELPIVATRLDSIAESFLEGETGILIPLGDLDALGVALGRLIADPELRARMGARARAFAAERYDMQRMTGAYESLYREALAAHPRKRR